MLISGLLALSCQKKNNVPPSPVSFKGYFRGKLNGTFFNDTVTGVILRSAANVTYISGAHPNGSVKITLNSLSGFPNNYPVNTDNMIFVGNNGGQFYAGFINGKIQGSGRISIAELTDSYIKGSFEGVLPSDSTYAILPTQVISEGEFKLKKP